MSGPDRRLSEPEDPDRDPDRNSGGRWSPFAGASALYVRAWVLYLILALVAAVWMSLAGRSLAAALGVQAPTAKVWLRDLGLGVACGLVALAAWEGLRRLPWGAELEARLRQLLSTVTRPEALALAVLSGFAEELFFRGALQPAAGLWLTAGIFGLAHLAPGRGGLLWAGWAAALGVVLGLMAQWTAALVAPIVAHATINAAGLWRIAGGETTEGSRSADDAGRPRVE